MIHTPEAEAVTQLILEVFRLNGQLLDAGDRLTKPLGLTSARWQVLGAIDLAGQPLTVPQIGRRMGVSRQAVQRVANDLEAAGFVAFKDNPDHARAKLVALTKKGQDSMDRVGARHIEWSNELADGMEAGRLTAAVEMLRELRLRCEQVEITNKPGR
ncbi:MAG: MarR family transcriptional regulator [Hyphomicrobiales bacterium]|nr:MarR family transcriptional regulator [Hyphomicrobiales bacterium]